MNKHTSEGLKPRLESSRARTDYVITEELDFLKDTNFGPEVNTVVAAGFSGKRHIYNGDIHEELKRTKDRLLCGNTRFKGHVRIGVHKLSYVTCKICLGRYKKTMSKKELVEYNKIEADRRKRGLL